VQEEYSQHAYGGGGGGEMGMMGGGGHAAVADERFYSDKVWPARCLGAMCAKDAYLWLCTAHVR
jgi:hypothetical protein